MHQNPQCSTTRSRAVAKSRGWGVQNRGRTTVVGSNTSMPYHTVGRNERGCASYPCKAKFAQHVCDTPNDVPKVPPFRATFPLCHLPAHHSTQGPPLLFPAGNTSMGPPGGHCKWGARDDTGLGQPHGDLQRPSAPLLRLCPRAASFCQVAQPPPVLALD